MRRIVVEGDKTYVIRKGKRIEVEEFPLGAPVIKRVVENGKTYAIRNGHRLEIETLEIVAPPKREPFQVEWVKLPRRWIEALWQSNKVSTCHLAHALLIEAFKCQQVGKEVVLSKAASGMPRNTRIKAARELVQLGLIKLHRKRRGQAHQVIIVRHH